MKSPEKEHWAQEIQEELDSLKCNEVWEIVSILNNRKLVGFRWVFWIKTNALGNLIHYKARLVAKGYSQIQGIDYEELFAPVTCYETLWLHLALSVIKHWSHKQLDIKTAFLNGNLIQEIYMVIPKGISLPKGLCCLLRKSLYGLKQSPREWHTCLTNFLQSQSFKRTNFDPCLFLKQKPLCFINIYVDDLFIFTEENSYLSIITEELSKKFEITDADLIIFSVRINFT